MGSPKAEFFRQFMGKRIVVRYLGPLAFRKYGAFHGRGSNAVPVKDYSQFNMGIIRIRNNNKR
ncbi:hypothetical protein CIHG_00986 [Coccidioides immitis H538.4]|uniref:Uncharacterized protein n=3 Tax=Coccidioides immitis TaxID=5501 RepID=A0A0J8QQD9_COCIT|nr:hypothetical protein CIRG_03399 [Coccidioides immitis RMSCC 2394]KMU74681.1 hypothetical protein CISG_00611 [Coccidioides immitis RMSCC 3703]KMU83204.1 hypothetical protein CIHG_00986 [Coccidioides immitis H538.4]